MFEFGTESCFTTTDVSTLKTCQLDSTHIVVAYSINHIGKAKVGLIAGNIVTWGPEYEFDNDEYVV